MLLMLVVMLLDAGNVELCVVNGRRIYRSTVVFGVGGNRRWRCRNNTRLWLLLVLVVLLMVRLLLLMLLLTAAAGRR